MRCGSRPRSLCHFRDGLPRYLCRHPDGHGHPGVELKDGRLHRSPRVPLATGFGMTTGARAIEPALVRRRGEKEAHPPVCLE